MQTYHVCVPCPVSQAVDRWCARYAQDLKASLSALQSSRTGSRAWLAAAVVSGEQLLLQQLKKGALMIMLGAAEVGQGQFAGCLRTVLHTTQTATLTGSA